MSDILKVGITCYPTIGGSGIVATELGHELAKRGHEVHFISYEPPFRLDVTEPNIFFHKVKLNEYTLFKYPDYTLPLAVKMSEVHRKHHLDLHHVHYAVPHATAALLGRQIALVRGEHAPRVITTLHGTDITLLGQDVNLQPIIEYSINSSCGVTAVSEGLKRQTCKLFDIKKEIRVIYNFYTPKTPSRSRADMRRELGVGEGDVLVIHLSNVRPVKRIPDLLQATALASVENPLLKLLIIAGGDFKPFQSIADELKLGSKLIVRQNVSNIEDFLQAANIGFFPSEDESFGMGILEVMSFGHPVIATRVGGIPEVVEDNHTGILHVVGDVVGMAKSLNRLARDQALQRQWGENARRRAQEHFSTENVVGNYIEYYQEVLQKPIRKDC